MLKRGDKRDIAIRSAAEQGLGLCCCGKAGLHPLCPLEADTLLSIPGCCLYFWPAWQMPSYSGSASPMASFFPCCLIQGPLIPRNYCPLCLYLIYNYLQILFTHFKVTIHTMSNPMGRDEQHSKSSSSISPRKAPCLWWMLTSIALGPHALCSHSTALPASLGRSVNEGRRDTRWGVDKIHYLSHRGVDTSLPRCILF